MLDVQRFSRGGQSASGEASRPQSASSSRTAAYGWHVKRWVASTRQVDGGQNCAERLLSGAVALFDHLGETARSGEGRAELGYCYYRQGLFDLARTTLRSSLKDFTNREFELKGIVLVRLATVERHASRLHDAVSLLNEADRLLDHLKPLDEGAISSEFATTLRILALRKTKVSTSTRRSITTEMPFHILKESGTTAIQR